MRPRRFQIQKCFKRRACAFDPHELLAELIGFSANWVPFANTTHPKLTTKLTSLSPHEHRPAAPDRKWRREQHRCTNHRRRPQRRVGQRAAEERPQWRGEESCGFNGNMDSHSRQPGPPRTGTLQFVVRTQLTCSSRCVRSSFFSPEFRGSCRHWPRTRATSTNWPLGAYGVGMRV